MKNPVTILFPDDYAAFDIPEGMTFEEISGAIVVRANVWPGRIIVSQKRRRIAIDDKSLFATIVPDFYGVYFWCDARKIIALRTLRTPFKWFWGVWFGLLASGGLAAVLSLLVLIWNGGLSLGEALSIVAGAAAAAVLMLFVASLSRWISIPSSRVFLRLVRELEAATDPSQPA